MERSFWCHCFLIVSHSSKNCRTVKWNINIILFYLQTCLNRQEKQDLKIFYIYIGANQYSSSCSYLSLRISYHIIIGIFLVEHVTFLIGVPCDFWGFLFLPQRCCCVVVSLSLFLFSHKNGFHFWRENSWVVCQEFMV